MDKANELKEILHIEKVLTKMKIPKIIYLKYFEERELDLIYFAREKSYILISFLDRMETTNLEHHFEELTLIHSALDHTYRSLLEVLYPKKNEIQNITHARKKGLALIFGNQLQIFEYKLNPLFFLNNPLEDIIQRNWNLRLVKVKESFKPLQEVILSSFSHWEQRQLINAYRLEFSNTYRQYFLQMRLQECYEELITAITKLGFEPLERKTSKKSRKSKTQKAKEKEKEDP